MTSHHVTSVGGGGGERGEAFVLSPHTLGLDRCASSHTSGKQKMKQICVNNITAWIEGEDKVLKLYQSEINEEEGTAEAWIASETGKVRGGTLISGRLLTRSFLAQTFSVHWKDALSTFDTVGRVTIDGQSCGGKLHKASFGAERAMCKRGKRESSDIRRPFEFVQLELTGAFTEVFASSGLQMMLYRRRSLLGRGARGARRHRA